jgi:hypothetical protein
LCAAVFLTREPLWIDVLNAEKVVAWRCRCRDGDIPLTSC